MSRPASTYRAARRNAAKLTRRDALSVRSSEGCPKVSAFMQRMPVNPKRMKGTKP